MVSESTERQKVHYDTVRSKADLLISSMSQKAPSAKRCIKTELERSSLNQFCFVRKHRAP